MKRVFYCKENTNLLLTEREGRTGEYWPEVVEVRTELARLVICLLYENRAMLVLNLPAFENKNNTANNYFRGNGPYDELPTKKAPIRTLGFTSTPPFYIISMALPW